MKTILIFITILITGCGLNSIRVDGTYEHDGQKIGGGTEWTFNKSNLTYYLPVSESDIRCLIDYHQLTFNSDDVQDFKQELLADSFKNVMIMVHEWVNKRTNLLLYLKNKNKLKK